MSKQRVSMEPIESLVEKYERLATKYERLATKYNALREGVGNALLVGTSSPQIKRKLLKLLDSEDKP